MRTITETYHAYTYDELTPKAQDKARDWWRSCDDQDSYPWWDFVYEDFERICGVIGVELNTIQIPLMNGSTRPQPDIRFSGFWSQGDGASFTGTWTYKPDAITNIKEYAPQDETLHRIATDLAIIQGQLDCKTDHEGSASAEIARLSSHYVHASTMRAELAEWESEHDETDKWDELSEGVTEAVRDLANWLYKTLEDEWNYRRSDEQVAENIRANEYEFLEDGTHCMG